MPESYYHITALPYKFTAAVFLHTTPRGRRMPGGVHRIRFGGKSACLSIHVYEGELEPELTGLSTNRECALMNMDHPELGLEPGIGTTRMAKAALRFVYTLFPEQGDMYFKDASHVACEFGSISLAYLYLAKHLKTWYQDKLGASLVDPVEAAKLGALVEILRGPYRESTYDEFHTRYITPKMRPTAASRLYDVFRKLYEAHRTYHSWFKAISREYDCAIMKDWLESFMRTVSPSIAFDAQWKIPKATILSWPDISAVKTTVKPAFPTFQTRGGGLSVADTE